MDHRSGNHVLLEKADPNEELVILAAFAVANNPFVIFQSREHTRRLWDLVGVDEICPVPATFVEEWMRLADLLVFVVAMLLNQEGLHGNSSVTA